MHRRPGSTLRAAKQALPVDSSLSPAEVFQHLEILERQHDGPAVVQQRLMQNSDEMRALQQRLEVHSSRRTTHADERILGTGT